MLVVISPAKKLDYSSSIEAPKLSQPALLDHAEELSIGLTVLLAKVVKNSLATMLSVTVLYDAHDNARDRRPTHSNVLDFLEQCPWTLFVKQRP